MLESAYRCNNSDCLHIFVATYRLVKIIPASDVERLSQSIGAGKFQFELDASYPRIINKTNFSQELASLSPSFIEAYNQAEEAEALGLGQVCGLGYRRAVEFLVKDYCIRQEPTDVDAIKAMPISQCLTKYIDDARIKDVAKRAIWLGNDEAHYVRKWATKDVGDLKILIKLSCNWIESMLLTDQYRNDMP